MKIKVFLTTLLVFGLFATPHAHAQLLKKILKKAENAVERTILNKTDEKVSQKTGEVIDDATSGTKNKEGKDQEKETENNDTYEGDAEDEKKAKGILDKLFGKTLQGADTSNDKISMPIKGEPSPAPLDNNVKLPNSYKFSYQATIQVTSERKTTEDHYLLQSNESYFAIQQTKNDISKFIVYDNDRNSEVHFIEIIGKKRLVRKKMDILTKAGIVGAFKDAHDKQVKPIGNKKILGFDCEGYEITTQVGTTELWITNETPATMYGAMFTNRAEANNSPFTKSTMVMEVTFSSKEATTNNYHMVCTQLEPKTKAFNVNEYN